MFSILSWSPCVKGYLQYRVWAQENSCAALHASATLSLNSQTVGMSLLYIPCVGSVSGRGSFFKQNVIIKVQTEHPVVTRYHAG